MLVDTFYAVVLLVVAFGCPYAVYQLVIAFLSRRRIKARFVSEIHEKSQPNLVRLEVEITNLGDRPTALRPSVKVSALDELSRCPANYEFVFEQPASVAVLEQDRHLKPKTPTTFVAYAVVSAGFVFSWYRRYTITISRGRRRTTIRHLNALHAPLGFFRYWYGYLRFRLSGWVPEETEHCGESVACNEPALRSHLRESPQAKHQKLSET